MIVIAVPLTPEPNPSGSKINPISSFVYDVTTQDGVISGVANTLPSITILFLPYQVPPTYEILTAKPTGLSAKLSDPD